MASVDITIDEIIALLRKSSLPTVVVEGVDDMVVYRKLEGRFESIGLSVLPVGGRDKVLEVYERRHELSGALCPVFVADLDSWAISGIPSEYVDSTLVFTTGYSIENDVYVDGQLRNLLNGSEVGRYESELSDFIEWFALALSRHIVDSTKPIALHPDHVLDSTQRPGLMALLPGEAYPALLRGRINAEYSSLLRGKSLLALLVRNVSYKGRAVRHHHNALMESVAVRPGALLGRIADRIAAHFDRLGLMT